MFKRKCNELKISILFGLLAASAAFLSYGCGLSKASAQSIGEHYLGQRVYLQSIVVDLASPVDEGGRAATVRLKSAAPLRSAQPRVSESIQTYLHVFPFSRRPGTAAAQLEPEVPKAVAALRSLELRSLGEAKNRGFRESQVGRDLPVITLQDESPRSTRRALSSNFLQVELADAERRPNQLLQVRVTGLTPKGVTGCVSAAPEVGTLSLRG